MHVHKNDIVEVTIGDDAGNTQSPTIGKVLRVMPDANKVVVRRERALLQKMRRWPWIDVQAESEIRAKGQVIFMARA
jgi:ribosomal protein L24